MAWLSSVFDFWRLRPVAIVSALPPVELRQRVRATLARERRAYKARPLLDRLDDPLFTQYVQGECDPCRLRLVVRRGRYPVRNGGTVTLVATVTTREDGGSDIRGIVGTSAYVRIFMACYLTLAFLITMVLLIVQPNPAVIVTAMMAMVGLVMCSMDAEPSQRDEAIVLAWLNARAGTSGDAERVGP
jgi:hypothetical protein